MSTNRDMMNTRNVVNDTRADNTLTSNNVNDTTTDHDNRCATENKQWNRRYDREDRGR